MRAVGGEIVRRAPKKHPTSIRTEHRFRRGAVAGACAGEVNADQLIRASVEISHKHVGTGFERHKRSVAAHRQWRPAVHHGHEAGRNGSRYDKKVATPEEIAPIHCFAASLVQS